MMFILLFKLEWFDKVFVVEFGVCGVCSCFLNFKSCFMKLRFGLMFGFFCFIKLYVLFKVIFNVEMR